MDVQLLLQALIMGIVEGLTEFLPISSTGHLIIAGDLIGFPHEIAATFEIFIQLGAILAVVVYFARDLFDLLKRARHDRAAQRLLLGVAVAFVPAAAVGVMFHSQIKAYLFNPFTVGLALVAGAVVMLAVEKANRQPTATALEDVSLAQALGVGLAQIVALFPGASRSASTIIGGLLVGMDRVTAVRFSFYLSIPTMVIATVYDLVRSLSSISAGQAPAFAVGLVTSFVVALIVIKWFLGYVGKHTLKPFAWYRLAAGLLMIALYYPRPA